MYILGTNNVDLPFHDRHDVLKKGANNPQVNNTVINYVIESSLYIRNYKTI